MQAIARNQQAQIRQKPSVNLRYWTGRAGEWVTEMLALASLGMALVTSLVGLAVLVGH